MNTTPTISKQPAPKLTVKPDLVGAVVELGGALWRVVYVNAGKGRVTLQLVGKRGEAQQGAAELSGDPGQLPPTSAPTAAPEAGA
jgi:hypothetical protein